MLSCTVLYSRIHRGNAHIACFLASHLFSACAWCAFPSLEMAASSASEDLSIEALELPNPPIRKTAGTKSALNSMFVRMSRRFAPRIADMLLGQEATPIDLLSIHDDDQSDWALIGQNFAWALIGQNPLPAAEAAQRAAAAEEAEPEARPLVPSHSVEEAVVAEEAEPEAHPLVLSDPVEEAVVVEEEAETFAMVNSVQFSDCPSNASSVYAASGELTSSAEDGSWQKVPPQRTSASPSSSPRGVYTWEQVTRPRPYLVVTCAYSDPVPAVDVHEADDLECDGLRMCRRLANPGFELLRTNLKDAEGLHVICHGDAPLLGECVPLIVGPSGSYEAATIDTWVQMLKPHVASLRHVYLGGCKTHTLGKALHERAGIECVVCWASSVEDKAARLFGRTYASKLGAGNAPREAFDAARQAVLLQQEDGRLDNSIRSRTQKYVFEDPCSPCVDPNTGRVRLSIPYDEGRSRRMLRGPIAAGVPLFLMDT